MAKDNLTVANKLRILKLTSEERDKIVKFNLTERHARALLKLNDEKDRMKVLNCVIEKQLNVKQTEDFIDSFIEKKSKTKSEVHRKIIIKDLRIFVNTIDKAIKTMKSSGINALSQKNETDEYLEYTVRIQKESAVRNVIRPWSNTSRQQKLDNNLIKDKMTS